MQKLSSLAILLILLKVGFSTSAATTDPFAKWEPEIQKFEAADRAQMPPQNAILFVGSSSIRFWTNLAEAFPSHTTIRRGFGGSTMADLLHFVDRIVLPYRPKQIFVYEGDNDIAAGKAPEQVVSGFQQFVAKVHEKLPMTEINYIAVKPSPSRWKLEAKDRAVNDAIKNWAHSQSNVGYIDIWTPMLGKDGKPRPELFVADKLHMNGTGYEIWRKVILPKMR